MAPGFKFLRADVFIQSILGGIYILLGLSALVSRDFVIFLLLLQFFFGGWQLLSGVILSIIKKDQKRITYLIVAATCFILLFLGIALISQGNFRKTKPLMIISMIITPMAIALWYYILSLKDYKQAKYSSNAIVMEVDNGKEHILDEGLWN